MRKRAKLLFTARKRSYTGGQFTCSSTPLRALQLQAPGLKFVVRNAGFPTLLPKGLNVSKRAVVKCEASYPPRSRNLRSYLTTEQDEKTAVTLLRTWDHRACLRRCPIPTSCVIRHCTTSRPTALRVASIPSSFNAFGATRRGGVVQTCQGHVHAETALMKVRGRGFGIPESSKAVREAKSSSSRVQVAFDFNCACQGKPSREKAPAAPNPGHRKEGWRGLPSSAASQKGSAKLCDALCSANLTAETGAQSLELWAQRLSANSKPFKEDSVVTLDLAPRLVYLGLCWPYAGPILHEHETNALQRVICRESSCQALTKDKEGDVRKARETLFMTTSHCKKLRSRWTRLIGFGTLGTLGNLHQPASASISQRPTAN